LNEPESRSAPPPRPAPARSPAEERADDEGPGFAPVDPLDGHALGDWQTRYHGAQRWIFLEAGYLLVLLALGPVSIFLCWHGNAQDWLGVEQDKTETFAKVAYVWIGGLLGGTTFSMKWLYHSVARGRWHLDRRLWRLFTPHLSAALALAIVALLTSNLVGVFDQDTIRQPGALFAIAFLAGYFSDNTVAALARLADQYLGQTSRSRGRGNGAGNNTAR
jgi:hypothetical protein